MQNKEENEQFGGFQPTDNPPELKRQLTSGIGIKQPTTFKRSASPIPTTAAENCKEYNINNQNAQNDNNQEGEMIPEEVSDHSAPNTARTNGSSNQFPAHYLSGSIGLDGGVGLTSRLAPQQKQQRTGNALAGSYDFSDGNLLNTPTTSEKGALLSSMRAEELMPTSLAGAFENAHLQHQQSQQAYTPVHPSQQAKQNYLVLGNNSSSQGTGKHVRGTSSASSRKARARVSSNTKHNHNNNNNELVTSQSTYYSEASHVVVAAQKDNVKVVIRVRPLNEREKTQGKQKECVLIEGNEKITLDRGADSRLFTFDYVATATSQQSEIFGRIAQPIADACLQGYNGSIFAYGQTGSGKTFTIQGPTIVVNGEEQIIGSQVGVSTSNEGKIWEMRGIMQRSFEYMFTKMEEQRAEAESKGIEMQFLVKSSYLEIYNEQIMDLLDPGSQNLLVREDIKKGVYVEALNEESVTGVKDMIGLITRGARNRHVGSTSMNKESSRSHSVLTTTIESKTMNEEGVWQMKSSRFHIIDLAGSERSKVTNAVGERLKEAGMINKSLSALGIVINSLVDISEGKTRHVHYRDSKLTFLLRDSLGGNSKTVIIANVTPSAQSSGETLSTLKFAQRAKLIKNKAVINEESSSTIMHLKAELRRTKKDLAEETSLRKQAEMRLKQTLQQQQQMDDPSPNNTNTNQSDQFDSNRSAGLAFANQTSESGAANNNPNGTLCAICKAIVGASGADVLDGNNEENTEADSPSNRKGPLSAEELGELSRASFMSTSGMDFSSGNVSGGGSTSQNVLKLYKQRMGELARMTGRVDKLERLLAANLESMEIAQQQADTTIENLTKSNRERLTALEAYEKSKSRDKMIIKFREERIQELEQKLSNLQGEKQVENQGDKEQLISNECKECPSLQRQLEDSREENARWAEVSERNPQAAKLFAEKNELLTKLATVSKELKVAPDSLNARITGLNNLTTDLSAYLKEYCEQESYQQLKELFEQTKSQLGEQVEDLTMKVAQGEESHAEALKALIESHQVEQRELEDRIETTKQTFAQEKAQLQQAASDQITAIKSDLETKEGQTSQQEQENARLKIEALEARNKFDSMRDQMQATLADLQTEKDSLQSKLTSEQKLMAQTLAEKKEAEIEHSEAMSMLDAQIQKDKALVAAQLKELSERAATEIEELEKEIMLIKEENRMLGDDRAETQRQLRASKDENETLLRRQIEDTERVKELERNIQEVRAQLAQSVSQGEAKVQLLKQAETDLKERLEIVTEQLNAIRNREQEQMSRVTQMETTLHEAERQASEDRNNLDRYRQQVADQESKEAKLVKDKTSLAEKVAEHVFRIEELSQSERLLKGRLDLSESKVDDIARLQVELATEKKKTNWQQNELEQSTQREKQLQKDIAKAEEQNSAMKGQMIAMEQVTVSLTKESNECAKQLKALQNSLEEKQKEVENAKSSEEVSKSARMSSEETAKKKLQDFEQAVTTLKHKYEDQLAEKTQQIQKQEMLVQEIQTQGQSLQSELTASKDQVSSLKQKVQTEREQYEKRLVQAAEEFKREATQAKFAMELDFQTRIENETNDLKRRKESLYGTEKAQTQEIVRLSEQIRQMRMNYRLKTVQVSAQFENLKSQHKQLVSLVKRELTWARVGPKADTLKGLVAQMKAVGQQSADLANRRQECTDLKEQLIEYKGLTQQLQEEKQALNGRLNTQREGGNDLISSSQLQQQQAQQEKIIESLNEQLSTSQTQLAEAHQMLSITEKFKQKATELQEELTKYKRVSKEQSSQLVSSKETISSIVSTENQLMNEAQKKIAELGEQNQSNKARLLQSKADRDAMQSKADSLKKENENLRELIKIKDDQIADSVQFEHGHRGERERLTSDLKKAQEQLKQQQTETKEIVVFLNVMANENKSLKKEVERLKELEMQGGHMNQAQKIQHHLRIKEENNKLREENSNLTEKLRRQCELMVTNPNSAGVVVNSQNTSQLLTGTPDATFGNLSLENSSNSQEIGQSAPGSDKKVKKELASILDSTSRLTETLLKQPGVAQFIQANESLAILFKKPQNELPPNTATSSQTYYANQRLKGTLEVITHMTRKMYQTHQDTQRLNQENQNLQRQLSRYKQTIESQGSAMIRKAGSPQNIPPSSSSSQSQFGQGSLQGQQVAVSGKSAQQIHQQQYSLSKQGSSAAGNTRRPPSVGTANQNNNNHHSNQQQNVYHRQNVPASTTITNSAMVQQSQSARRSGSRGFSPANF